MSSRTLSKARYLAGMQCPKRLWLEVHEPGGVPTPSPTLLASFDEGHEVGRLAWGLFPDGILVEGGRGHSRAVTATSHLPEDPSVNAIFEAALSYGGVNIRTDVLVRRQDGGFALVEVKKTKRVKDEHLLDLAIQVWVLQGCGLDITEAGILHLNGDYIRGSEGLDLEALFTFTSLHTVVEEVLAQLPDDVARLLDVLALPECPDIEHGPHCSSPWDCPFQGLCIPEPSRYAVTQLPRAGALLKKLEPLGIDDLRDVPIAFVKSAIHQRVLRCVVQGEEYVGSGLHLALTDVEYPLYFLDFETFMPAVPRYEGTGCYQALTTQWSCHILHVDGSLTHMEFLHDQDTDPRLPFLHSLLDALGDAGTIVVYSSYEATQLRALANAFPEHADEVAGVIDRFLDLLKVIRAEYYHPGFGGSFSIKAVLPVLVPELSYEDLDIQDGLAAAVWYRAMIEPSTPRSESQRIWNWLRAYCERDTLAMVRVRDALMDRCR